YIYNSFREGTRVYVTLPGGKREGFTFRPQLSHVTQLLLRFSAGPIPEEAYLYVPAFVPDPGVTSKLLVPEFYLAPDGEGGFQNTSGGGAYNPSSPIFDGVYGLVTKDGITYEINGTTGDVDRVTDPNGNTLTFTDSAIVSSAGQAVTFERDPQGRISA